MAWTLSGPTSSITPSMPWLTGETTGYYEDFGALELLARALRQGWVYTGEYSPHRRRVHGRPPARAGEDTSSSCSSRTTIRSATGRSVIASPIWLASAGPRWRPLS